MSLLTMFKTKELAEATEPAKTAAPAGETLEDVLLELAKWGRPRISIPSSRGWYCCVEVNITLTGAKFEVSSDFGIETPLAAALQCRERLRESAKAIGGAA